jgi:hypothetical protein
VICDVQAVVESVPERILDLLFSRSSVFSINIKYQYQGMRHKVVVSIPAFLHSREQSFYQTKIQNICIVCYM